MVQWFLKNMGAESSNGLMEYLRAGPSQAMLMLTLTRMIIFYMRHVLHIIFGTPEPGYYTTSSYYGAKDVLALAFAFQHEEDGAGTGTTAATQGDFTGWNIDLLMEKKLSNGGVVNLEGAYYDYDTDDIPDTSLIQGEGYLALASYLLPDRIGWGKVQPYVRYQHFARRQSNTVAANLGNSIGYGGRN